MDFIDVVYCWVCGEDDLVQKSMRQNKVHISADRCFSNDLIRQSIKLFVSNSTHKGRIIIISHSGVCPPNIHRVCNRITVIDQDVIIPDKHTPVFIFSE